MTIWNSVHQAVRNAPVLRGGDKLSQRPRVSREANNNGKTRLAAGFQKTECLDSLTNPPTSIDYRQEEGRYFAGIGFVVPALQVQEIEPPLLIAESTSVSPVMAVLALLP